MSRTNEIETGRFKRDNGKCMVFGCDKPVHCRNMCRSHYRKSIGESKRRYKKVMADPVLKAKLKKAMKAYRQTDKYKKIKALADKRYAKRHKIQMARKKKLWRENLRFSGQREEVLKRDGYKCIACGSKDNLIVHHMDGKGRGYKPNNEIDNLVTLCRACHMKVHFWNLVI